MTPADISLPAVFCFLLEWFHAFLHDKHLILKKKIHNPKLIIVSSFLQDIPLHSLHVI